MEDLIAKLAAASGADRELDAEIAVALSGDPEAWVVNPSPHSIFSPVPGWWRTGDDESHEAPAYTGSADAIGALIGSSSYRLYMVDASIEGRFSVILKGLDRLWPATEDQEECIAPGWEAGVGPTLPLALCIAHLRAAAVQVTGVR